MSKSNFKMPAWEPRPDSCANRERLYNRTGICLKGQAMRIVNLSETGDSLRAVLDQVVADADVTVITRERAPDAVVMSLDHYNGLMETLYLLGSPANVAHLERSIAQARAGAAKSRELVEVPETGNTDAQPEVLR